jgi:outer membrane protein assembly factor BamD (BamD/ComL family)
MKELYFRVMTAGIACLLLTGCALFQKTPPPKAPRQQHVDVKAQQYYYDIGLQQYSKENYGEAKDAFEKVIEFGPTTSLGIKAQDNLKKIQRILKTLDEIDSK